MANSLGAVAVVGAGVIIGYWTLTGKMLNIVQAVKGVSTGANSNTASPTQPTTNANATTTATQTNPLGFNAQSVINGPQPGYYFTGGAIQ